MKLLLILSFENYCVHGIRMFSTYVHKCYIIYMEEVLVCEQETQEMLQYLFEGGDCDHNCNIHCGQ